MEDNMKEQSSILNSKLRPFGVLIGKWDTVGAHPLLPGITLHGHTSFSLIEEGAFLLMHTDFEEEAIPNGVAVFGSDDSAEIVSMLYFDVRGVSRIYETSVDDSTWKFWRNAPGFSQRYTCTFADDGNTIFGQGELSKNGLDWEKDLSLIYTRTI